MINGFPDAFAKRYSFADELKRDSWNEGRVITAEEIEQSGAQTLDEVLRRLPTN